MVFFHKNYVSKISDLCTGDIREVSLIIEEFVSRMYSLKKITNVNEARVAVFIKNYKNNDGIEIFKTNTKNVDGAILPPCKTELQKHIIVRYQTNSFHCASFETRLSTTAYRIFSHQLWLLTFVTSVLQCRENDKVSTINVPVSV